MIKQQAKEGGETVTCSPCEPAISPSSDTATPMEMDTETTTTTSPAPSRTQPADIKPAPADTASSPPKATKKKKKKKTSYKDMMASMTKRTKDEKDIQKEKENLRKVTGGGAFSKIDKI